MGIEQFEEIALRVGIGALVFFMGFIVYDLARKSRAGRLGSAVLFVALCLGVLGFLIKTVIYQYLVP
ncbi:hypothetical protein CI610_00629 [invertebrate metagenome]|uniref:DUF2788 domain-containing protein n=1 Tax=invertebrate metagenome TaxID=1711999 RepID=A0A2H9TB23_9ZZZZ